MKTDPNQLSKRSTVSGVAVPVMAALVGLCAIHPGDLSGQAQPGRGISAAERDAALKRAAAALEAARRQRGEDSSIEALKAAADSEQASQLKAAAAAAISRRLAPPDPDKVSRRGAGEAALEEAKSQASPAAAALIQESARRNRPAPATTLVAQAASTGGSEAGRPFDPAKVPVPERVDAPPKDKEEKSDQVVITATKAAYFDANSRIAIFTGDVAVDHPGFDLFCDHLEVHFKEAKKEGAGEGTEGESENGEAPAGAMPGGGSGEIDVVVATGKEVKIHKLSADGKLQIGKCKKAIFKAAEGTLEMMVWPQVQQGKGIVIGKTEDTRMVFTQAGEMEVIGEQETRLVRDAEVPEVPGR